MAIHRLFEEAAFDDAAVKAMTTAYEDALAELDRGAGVKRPRPKQGLRNQSRFQVAAGWV